MAANNRTSVNLNLPQTPETTDPKVFFESVKIYNAINTLARALDAYTGVLPPLPSDWPDVGVSGILLQHQARLFPIFDADVTTGAMINVYNVAGVLHARLAKAADGTKPARGYATSNVTAGDVGEIILFGLAPVFTGLTPGVLYYLSESSTTGQITSVRPVTVGNLIQPVGFALTDHAIFFNPVLDGVIV